MSWEQFMQGVANDMKNEIVRRAPMRTGTLINSIQVVSVEGDEIVIGMVHYGKYVEYGTPPHTIRPVDAKALRWKEGGEYRFAKEVHHPGTRPQPFIRPAIHQRLGKVIEQNAKRHL